MMKTNENSNSSSSDCNNNSNNHHRFIDSLTVPTLLWNSDICRDNIARMVESARQQGVQLRPHFKTHQSRSIGAMFLRPEFNIRCATVSSLQMARYFATGSRGNTASCIRSGGGEAEDACYWRDLTVAFPFNVHEIDTVNELLQLPDMRLGLTIENQQALAVLLEKVHFFGNNKEAAAVDAGAAAAESSYSSVLRLWIKVDAGYHRTGIPIQDVDEIRKILRLIEKKKQQQQEQQAVQVVALDIGGILLHSGHSYKIHKDNFVAGIDAIHQDALQKVSVLHEQLGQEFPDLEYSIGDTPSCSRIAFANQSLNTQAYCCNGQEQVVTEIRPGNFVFYDVMQYYIGSIPSLDHIAVCMACPVVAKHVERQEIVVYGGAVHFSKDSITISAAVAGIIHDDKDDHTVMTVNSKALSMTATSRGAVSCWGLVVSLDPVTGTWNHNDGAWRNSFVSKLSQEHGVIYTPCMEQFDKVNIGDWVGILPIHSCLTADIMGEYVDIQTRQRVDSMRSRSR